MIISRGSKVSWLDRAYSMDLNKIEQRVLKVQHGFGPMREVALNVLNESDSTPKNLRLAKDLYESKDYQVRMVAVFILGHIASKSREALRMLRKTVSQDESWQVQEILAQAFNEYCKSTGYKESIPTIKDWITDGAPNARRAVSEGLRIWNQKDYFREHPELAIKFLAKLKDDDSEYVRRSAGNAIRDISRKEKELVRAELAKWDTSNPKIEYTYELASKFL